MGHHISTPKFPFPMGQSAQQSQFCIIPQVHLSVCPVKCGKWLIGYGCYLEWSVKWKDEEYRVLKWTCTYRMTHGTLNTATQPNSVSVRPSVRAAVCHTPVLCHNGSTEDYANNARRTLGFRGRRF